MNDGLDWIDDLQDNIAGIIGGWCVAFTALMGAGFLVVQAAKAMGVW